MKSRNLKAKPNIKSQKQSTMSPALNQGISGTRFSVYMENIVSETEKASKKAEKKNKIL